MTYPGNTQLPVANCQSTLGPNGNITIYIPLSQVNEFNPIDNRLHEVTASTMTLTQPANTNPSFGGVGGTFFNLIDVAQGYTFDPTPLPTTAVSRKSHGSISPPFDINLPLFENPGIECRTGGASGNHQIVLTFPVPVTFTSASVSSGTGSVAVALASGNQVFVNLTGVANGQTIAITLFGVNDGTNVGNVTVPMGVLLGDVDASARVDSNDVFAVRQQTLQPLPPIGTADFRRDIDASGRIDSNDVFISRQQALTGLP
jgi:hypothetical protein